MNDSIKGEHTGLSGAEYGYESVNVRPGVAPTTMWLAIEADEGPGLVAVVGHADQILAFGRRVARGGHLHPVSLLPLLEGAGDALRPAMQALWPRDTPSSFAVSYAGLWPPDRIRGVVTQLTGGGRNGWRGWAREFAKLRSDPQRVDAGPPDEKMTKELVELFFQQCTKVASS